MTTAYLEKLADKISYPSYLNGTELSEQTIRSILGRVLNLCKLLRDNTSYSNKQTERLAHYCYSMHHCWLGVEAYINGSRDWDSCMGVNNPYLMGDAKIKH